MNEKKLVLVCAPITTVSGYGSRSRDICKALISSDKYDVRIMPILWGNTPTNALKEGEHDEIIRRLTNKVERQPDIFIHITIPSEFNNIGKLSIGITAGIETTLCRHDWIIGCNRMDLTLVSSNHSKEVLEKTIYEKGDKNDPQKVVETLKLIKPVEILFEGVDTNVFNKNPQLDLVIKEEIDSIKEAQAFLFVGHWLQGHMGHDRKDVGMLVKVFCDIFKTKPPKKRPALILKTSGATFSETDRYEIQNKLWMVLSQYEETARPSIYLLHGELSDVQMNSLYNHPKVKAMISFTKGEGFGRPLLEFTTTGKPVIASNWSGQKDFLSEKHSVLLPGKLEQVHPSSVNDWILRDAKWFTVDYNQAALKIYQVFSDYEDYLKLSKIQANITKRDFTLDLMGEKLIEYIEKYYSNKSFPELRELQPLAGEMQKITNLPKLRKV